MFEIGFMPEALSINPQPYRHNWPQTGITAGWSYPPKDYGKWEELNFQIVQHCVERYGKEDVDKWLWEVWNEPDIGYWKGTPEEYFQLYASAVKGVRRALPTAKVGGPGATGPANPKAAAFLKFFLDRCAQTNVPIDFISYHAKGHPSLIDGHVRMGLEKELSDVEAGLNIIEAFPKFRGLPIILSEADPEGCAACSARNHPENAYRNGPLYATYTAAALNGIQQLADQHHMNIEGMLTWAFEFEDQPYFEGFRTLATNGIDKPVLNVFRMFGLLSGTLLPTTSTPVANRDPHAVRSTPYASDAIATRHANTVTVMLWNYHPNDIPGPDTEVTLDITGLTTGLPTHLLLQHYRIDEHHSNAYTMWKQMGSPQQPSSGQINELESAAQLQPLTSPEWLSPVQGRLQLTMHLPYQSVDLIVLTGGPQ
jgi:xylan 1,4-beta-xylosidase